MSKEDVYKRLPKQCVALNPVDNTPVMVFRGEYGYIETTETLESFNAPRGITPAQVSAMLVGSMFGFHCSAADPLTYDADGLPHKS